MRRLEVDRIETFNATEVDPPKQFEVTIGDRALSYDDLVNNTPAITTEYDGPGSPQLVLGSRDYLEPWDDARLYPAIRLDPIHGRTLEVAADHINVEDQFGNNYHSLNVKGCDFTDPHFFETRTAARKYIIHGLQESIVMERILRASKLLRQHGIGTEYILGISQPRTFPLDRIGSGIDHKELVELPAFLEHMAHEFAKEQHPNSSDPIAFLETKQDMVSRFEDTDYLITYRAMETPYRAKEISDPEKYAAFAAHTEKYYGQYDIGAFVRERDQDEYLSRVLAWRLALNVGSMHRIGVYHGFLVPLNVSALGSIIDLDSCRGEPLGLGDEPATEKDYIKDVAEAIRTIAIVTSKAPYQKGSHYKNVSALHGNVYRSAKIFLEYYLDSRFSERSKKIAFLASLVRYSTETYDHGDEDKFGYHLYNTAQQTYDLYNDKFRPHIPKQALPDLEPAALPFTRSQSFLRAVPASYFRKHRNKILDENWTQNHKYKSETKTKRPIQHPVQPLVLDMAYHALWKREGNPETARLNDRQLLFLAGCALRHRPRPRTEENIAKVNHAKEIIDRQKSAVLDMLCELDDGEVSAELRPLIEGSLSHLRDQVASIRFNSDHNTSILYLKNDEQYAEVFRALKLNESTPVEPFSYDTIYDIIEHGVRLKENQFIIADYTMAQWMAEQENRKRQYSSFLWVRDNSRPYLIVQGHSSNTTHLWVRPPLAPNMGLIEPLFTFEGMLAQVAPSLVRNKGRLFKAPIAKPEYIAA